MIHFIGNDGVIFQGTRQDKTVRVQSISQTKSVQPVLFLDDGIPCIGIDIYKDAKTQEREDDWVAPATQPLSIIALYRLMMLLETYDELSNPLMAECARAVVSTESEDLIPVMNRIGLREFQRISTEMPPNLPGLFAYLDEEGVEFRKMEFTNEARMGNVVYNETLQRVGVENPVDVDEKKRVEEEQLNERKRREEAAVEPFMPQLNAYLQKLGHDPDCKYIGVYRLGAIQALQRGITEPGLVVGMAAIYMKSISKAFATRGFQIFILSNGGINVDRKEINKISAAVVQIIEEPKPKEKRNDIRYYVRALSDLQQRWNTLPVNNL